MDEWIEYFCAVAHERAKAIGEGEGAEGKAPGGGEALGKGDAREGGG